jgi:acyl carrier protein
MNNPEIEKRFADTVRLTLNPLSRPKKDEPPFKPEQKLVEDLGFDSLGLVELVLAVEEDFDLDIPDEDLEGILTYGQALAYVQKRLENAG